MGIGSLIANAGTPLMWAGCFQLFIGNILLGYFEAWLIRRRSGKRWVYSEPMILANYLSMFVGFGIIFAFAPWARAAKVDPFRHALPMIVILWLVSYIVTVLVEWPFVAKTAGVRTGRGSLLTSAWVQAVSYAFLLLVTVFIGSISAVIALRPVSATEIDAVQGWVYYLAPDESRVLRTRLDGSKTEQVATLDFEIGNGRFRITTEPTSNGDRARLLYREYGNNHELAKHIGEATQVAPFKARDNDNLGLLHNLTHSYGAARKFVDSPQIYAGFWPREGLVVDAYRYALETPYLMLSWSSPVLLPDGKVVAQFGKAIMLVDHDTKRVAKLAEGFGGDVLLDR